MTPKQLAKKLSELCLLREQLQQERAELIGELVEARQIKSVAESVKASARVQSQVDAIDSELVIVSGMIDDESNGLDAAIAPLQDQVKDNERDHAKAMRSALSEFLQSDRVQEARKTIAAVEALVYEINPMSEFTTHDACKHLLRNSRELQTVALAELVTLPEEQPDPPELELLIDAQRAIRDATPMVPVTAGSEPRVGTRVSCQPSNEDRQKVIDEIAAQRNKASAA